MKKTLLSLALMVLGMSAHAENITEDWSAASWGPKAQSTTVSTAKSSSTGIEYTFYNTKTTGGYAFLKGSTTNGGYISFVLPINCSEIQLKTSSGCSTKDGNTIALYAEDNVIKSKFKVNGQNTEYKIAIPSDYRKAGTVYKILADGSNNPQIVSTVYVEETSDPSLSIAKTSLSFAVPSKASQTVAITGVAENIDGNISVSVDNSNFTLSAASVSAEELAAGVEVTYTGNAVGTETANLSFETGSLKVVVPLSGITVANEGTEANPLTVADVLAMKNLNSGPFYVTGTIGDKCAANAKDGMVAEAASNVNNNIVLKDSEGNMIGVQLPAGDARTKLNIVDNSTNIGKTVIIKGSLEDYFGAPGVKNTEYISGLSTVGIADIVADDANAPVEYFNLQGIRVENPENGLYIRRQGSKVSKVLVK